MGLTNPAVRPETIHKELGHADLLVRDAQDGYKRP